MRFQDFTIYLIDGRNFQVKDVRFEITKSELIFFNVYDQLSIDELFLPFDSIAAVIPKQAIETKKRHYKVFLKENEAEFLLADYLIQKDGDSKLIVSHAIDKAYSAVYINFNQVLAVVEIKSE